ncbi:MAG: ankyrin repeat domain-containing protein [Gammaproteobacteria bacterium]|nr:ankyrin repeat domain-containing protein [Gammaproteobacteria bacterium]
MSTRGNINAQGTTPAASSSAASSSHSSGPSFFKEEKKEEKDSKKIALKAGTFGISYVNILSCNNVDEMYSEGRRQAIEDYILHRKNGGYSGCPARPFPKHGKISEIASDDVNYKCFRYDEDAEDKRWMEEKDCGYMRCLKSDVINDFESKVQSGHSDDLLDLSESNINSKIHDDPLRLESYHQAMVYMKFHGYATPVYVEVNVLNFYPLTTQDVKGIIKAIKGNSYTHRLSLAGNREIKDDVIDLLVDVYTPGWFSSKCNKTLLFIDLSGTGVTHVGIERLKKATRERNLAVTIKNDFDSQELSKIHEAAKAKAEMERKLAEEKKQAAEKAKKLEEENKKKIEVEQKAAEAKKLEAEQKEKEQKDKERIEKERLAHRADRSGQANVVALPATTILPPPDPAPVAPATITLPPPSLVPARLPEAKEAKEEKQETRGKEKLEQKASKHQEELNANLLEAAKHGNLDAVQHLVTAGANVANVKDKYSCTALLWAACYGHTTTVKWLLEHGARIDERSNYGSTALLEAAWRGHTATVEWLLEHGARIDEGVMVAGATLLGAARNGKTATIEWLLNHGANILEKDKSSQTAIDIARQSNKTETVAFLEAWQKYSEAKSLSSPPTLPKAVYLKTAGDPNNEPYAQYRVGQCCEAERNAAEAISWYQKAADSYLPARLSLERLQKENEAKLASAAKEQKASEDEAKAASAAKEQKAREALEAKSAAKSKSEIKEDNLVAPLPLSQESKEEKKQEAKESKESKEIKESKEEKKREVEGKESKEHPAQNQAKTMVSEISEAQIGALRQIQTLMPNLAAVGDINPQALHELQGEAKTFMGTIDRERLAQLVEQEKVYILRNPNLGDYYYSFIAQFTSVFIACKNIHSGKAKDEEKTAIDYLSQGADALGRNIPGLSILTSIFSGAIDTYSARNKKLAANKIATFFVNTTEADIFIESLARRLTFTLELEINNLDTRTVGILKRVLNTAIALRDWFQANEIDTAIKKFAEIHCKNILHAIIEEKLIPHPSAANIEAFVHIALPEQAIQTMPAPHLERRLQYLPYLNHAHMWQAGWQVALTQH